MTDETEPQTPLEAAQKQARMILEDESPGEALETARQQHKEASGLYKQARENVEIASATVTILESIADYTDGAEDSNDANDTESMNDTPTDPEAAIEEMDSVGVSE